MKPWLKKSIPAAAVCAAIAIILILVLPKSGAVSFGSTKEGKAALYTLKNKAGMTVRVTDYGAGLVQVLVPDRNGGTTDVVLGYDDAAGYEAGTMFIGGTVGRAANRIGNASFELDGQTCALTANEGANTLHGGCDFYNQRLWKAVNVSASSVTFHLDSPDKDQGFPGSLSIDVTYSLSEDNALSITYNASSDANTIFAPVNHSYFNLNGGGDVRDQLVWIDADSITENDEEQIPTGKLLETSGTAFDFSVERAIGAARDGDYDHNFVLNGEGFRKVASLRSKTSGITMTVSTDMPGLQVYTSGGLNDTGKNGTVYQPFCAICFETQFFPDAVHHENFVQPVLKAGETFCSKTVYAFSAAN